VVAEGEEKKNDKPTVIDADGNAVKQWAITEEELRVMGAGKRQGCDAWHSDRETRTNGAVGHLFRTSTVEPEEW
jgi:hypothetical protein